MAISDARAALERERAALQNQIDLINEALAVLQGVSPDPSRRNERKSSRPKKTSRADLSPEQAVARYGAEAVTCPECGRVTRAPQGMKAHLRSHR